MSNTLADADIHELAETGYTLVDGIETDDAAEEILRRFGTPITQYSGSLRYQVKAEPGFENRRYSKSVNTILVHTEAPGWVSPPRYLALHCRTQATCGSGHTELADGRKFVASLTGRAREAVYGREINWIGHNIGGTGSAGVNRPIVERTESGAEIIRFSYNLLTAGHYDPPVDAAVPSEQLPLNSLGVDIAELATDFFRTQKTSILIPENSILIWDNQRMFHARSEYKDFRRHLTRYWLAESK